jgi:hypothetical protein
VNTFVRRVSCCAVLGAGLLAGVTVSAVPTSAQSCDPAYINYCVPPIEVVGISTASVFATGEDPTASAPIVGAAGLEILVCIGFSDGGPPGIRTLNQWIKSPLLCR